MGNKFYISAVSAIDNDKCLKDAAKRFPEGVSKCIRKIVFDTDKDSIEKEETLYCIEGQSISGVKISTLKDGDTSVFLGWNASGMDVFMCFEYMRSIKRFYPEAIITSADSDGNKTDCVADLSEDAKNDAWVRRIEIMITLLTIDEEEINIPAFRYTYNLQPKKFVNEMEDLSFSDKVIKLYDDIIDMQWNDLT